VDVYDTRHPKNRSVVPELLHANTLKTGKQRQAGRQTGTEKRGTILLHFITISPRRRAVAYIKTIVYPDD
jgi:hypothetical protein